VIEYQWIAESVFTIEGLLTAEECAELIAIGEAVGFGEAPINSLLGPMVFKDIRNNQRAILDEPALASRLWPRAAPYIPAQHGGRVALGFNQRFRFYRYDVGQQFDWHRDGAFARENGERSQITVLIYLNEYFTGGETSFDDPKLGALSRLDIVPKTGAALFFDHPLVHKGQPVLAGRKYVVRTDVMYSALQ
jgi:predicted 2-oxoglutarate/Fe(II)-dependent dioxygenase YbiX